MRVSDIDAAAVRVAEHTGVHRSFLRRWSPRAMSGEPVRHDELLQLLEAARWAPSCFNAQPWHFVYAYRGSDGWDPLFGTLAEGNRTWVARAGALLACCSRTTFERNGKANRFHALDAGAAWQSLALQAMHLGLVCHGMGGFDEDAARAALELPEEWTVQCMIAVGRPGRIEDLPDDYQEREKPSTRKPIAEIASEGVFRE
jgi:nitroreductase